MKQTLSIRMANALSQGKTRLSMEAQQRIQTFIQSQQLDNGSFKDKNGQPDLYYTAFGWLLCYVFNQPLPRVAARNYLNAQPAESLDLVHYAAFLRCRLLYRLLTRHHLLATLSTALFPAPVKLDTVNGYPHKDPQAPYSLFLRLSLLEDAGKPALPKEWLQPLHTYRTPDGGYSNLKGSTTATINATAAALCVLEQSKSDEASATARFLLSRQHASGGFAASPDAPLPDLLSTATALFALHLCGAKPNASARDFIEAHWNEHTGGFSATLFDETSDIEYTFYGLLALGTL